MQRLQNWRLLGRASRGLALVAFGFGIASCNSTNGPDVPEGITAVSGNDQAAAVGTAAPNPLVARVVDASGAPFSGATVTWTVTGGGGSVADSTSVSDATGHAAMTYTAGSSPAVATIVATVAQVWTTTFTVYVESQSNAIRIR
jgi:hypothetical protein